MPPIACRMSGLTILGGLTLPTHLAPRRANWKPLCKTQVTIYLPAIFYHSLRPLLLAIPGISCLIRSRKLLMNQPLSKVMQISLNWLKAVMCNPSLPSKVLPVRLHLPVPLPVHLPVHLHRPALRAHLVLTLMRKALQLASIPSYLNRGPKLKILIKQRMLPALSPRPLMIKR